LSYNKQNEIQKGSEITWAFAIFGPCQSQGLVRLCSAETRICGKGMRTCPGSSRPRIRACINRVANPFSRFSLLASHLPTSRDGCLPVAAQRHIFQARTVSARKRLHRPPTFTRLTALSLSCGSSVPFQASTLFTYSPHSAERRLRARRCCSRRSPNPSSSNAEAALLVATLAADSCPALLGYTLYANMKVSEVAALFGADSAAVLAANALDFALDPYCL
jgi:hypothetical protein